MTSIVDTTSKIKLEEVVSVSTNLRSVLITLGYRNTCRNAYKKLRDRLLELNISTDHFQPKSIIGDKMTFEEYANRDGPKRGTLLRKKILEEGLLQYECNICSQLPKWNKKILVLQVDHIDGNRTNNNIDNLRFLCPNCHTQTETFAGRNKRKRSSNVCIDCNQDIAKGSKQCRLCCNKSLGCKRRKIERPSRESLWQMIQKQTFTSLSIQFGVSDNAIRKWCKMYGLPTRPEEIRHLSQNQ